ncbi:antibiotic resistance protein [Brachyspira hampsonii]|uniref:Antibiotic resistance protein n=2 Tax=Brachyspira hampsonii TaxID=1287055 RepID=A0AAC9TTK7_9SPIR|nr:pyridoxamine 5'-phosphate oxidase family protein [Brachyspira hampsonii]ASJ20151.1 antibiotic resistance protein [Brachyspira hampsonii]MBW5379673.1 antibiotic resistance protein [Brachyspira hampsonii]OEJ16587.1 antibiotic resistance protein [Brachyspira hampsonii]
MRRKDFIFEDKEEICNMLNSIEFGVMALPDDIPYAVPISFCYKNNEIYFHGAMAGRKYEILKNNPKVSFSASKPYSYIPSQFLNGKMIPTQFFFSVFIEGKFETIDDISRRKEILYKIVRKYEPNNYNLSIDNKMFDYAQNNMLIGVIKIENITAKAKFGQNMSYDEIKIIIEDLKTRAEKIDIDTIEMINKMRK